MTFESYKNGKPGAIAQVFEFKKEPGNRYSTNGNESKKNFYRAIGDKLVHESGHVTAHI